MRQTQKWFLPTVLVYGFALPLFSQGLVPFDCNGDFYNVFARTIRVNDFTPSTFARITIDQNNFVEFEEIGRLRTEINGIGYRVSDNLIYGMTQNDNTLIRIGRDGSSENLRTLTELPTANSYFAADVTPDGDFLVLLGNNQRTLTQLPTNSLVFVDLTKPEYPTDQQTLSGSAFIPDLAFDPFEDRIAYGYDGNTRQLLRIDVASRQVTAVGVPGQQAEQLTSIYFDPLGRLFGYGPVSDRFGFRQYFLFSIDKQTGRMRTIAEGPEANKNDGCSCPYQVSLQENVSPRTSVACTEMQVTYTLANATGQTRSGLSLSEDLPAGFSVVELVSNPFGGTYTAENGQVRFTDLTLPLGIDSIVLNIVTDASATGVHHLQSELSGLPFALGSTLFSDDPTTFNVTGDATQIEVRELSVDYLGGGSKLCPNDSLVFVFDTIAGATYTVNGEPFSGVYTLTQGGNYVFRAYSGCNTLQNDITVVDVPAPEIDLPPGTLIELGDSLQIIPFNIAGVDPFQYNWRAVFGDPRITCPDCSEPFVRPFVSTLYQLDFTDANDCTVSDTILIRVDSELYFYAPNAFSPNGDGTNDDFALFSSRPYLLKTFAVVDRWGTTLFRQDHVRLQDFAGWDGRFRGQMMNPGVYVWMAVFALPDGSEVTRGGDINLIR